MDLEYAYHRSQLVGLPYAFCFFSWLVPVCYKTWCFTAVVLQSRQQPWASSRRVCRHSVSLSSSWELRPASTVWPCPSQWPKSWSTCSSMRTTTSLWKDSPSKATIRSRRRVAASFSDDGRSVRLCNSVLFGQSCCKSCKHLVDCVIVSLWFSTVNALSFMCVDYMN